MSRSSKGRARSATRTGSRAADGRRRGARRALRLVLVTALVGAVAAGLPLAIWAGYRAVIASGYFAPDEVQIHGNELVDDDEILRLAGLTEPGVNLVDLEAAEIASRIEAHPRIASAEVETQLPDEVTITVVERHSVGLVFEDQLYEVDADGRIIAPWSPAPGEELGALVSGTGLVAANASGDEAAATFAHARAVEGLDIVRMYRGLGLDRRVELGEVHWDPAIGWTLFAEELEVRLGMDRFGERLERLWQVFEVLDRHGTSPEYVLLDADEHLDRVAVKVRPILVEGAPPSDDFAVEP